MKQNKLKFLMSLVLMLCVLPSFSQTFKSKGITYTIYDSGKAGVVKGNYSGKVVIPSQVNYYGTTFTVTSIGDAFERCKSLTSVVLPNTIKYVDGFRYCTRLTSVTLGNSVIRVSGFEGCKSLRSIIIPNSVTEIGSYAFEGCTSLTSVTIGESVTTIGGYAFKDCTGLTKIICKAKTPPSFSYGVEVQVFFDYYKPTLYVPAESIDKYKNALFWGRFVKIRAIE